MGEELKFVWELVFLWRVDEVEIWVWEIEVEIDCFGYDEKEVVERIY